MYKSAVKNQRKIIRLNIFYELLMYMMYIKKKKNQCFKYMSHKFYLDGGMKIIVRFSYNTTEENLIL